MSTRLHHARSQPVRGTSPRPTKRRLDLAEVEQRRAHWQAQAPSPARAAALKTIREQLKSIRHRVGDAS